MQAVLDRALDGVETANFEFPLITKAGARIEVLLNATTRRNEHGKVIGVVGIGQDITGMEINKQLCEFLISSCSFIHLSNSFIQVELLRVSMFALIFVFIAPDLTPFRR